MSWPASAHDPAGTWTSSSGSRVEIWANMQIVQVTIRTPQGQVYKYNGAWNQFGESFSYNVPGQGSANCVFQGPNQLLVQSPSGPATWTRGTRSSGPGPGGTNPGGQSPGGTYPGGQQPGAPLPGGQVSSALTGVWRSSSGNSFQITTSGMQIFVVLITPQGQRAEGSGRWLQYPRTFEYSIPSMGNAMNTVTVSDNDSLMVQSPTGPTRWTRMR